MEAPRVRPTIVYTIEESITAAGGVAYILLYTVHSNVSLSMPKHEDCMIDPKHLDIYHLIKKLWCFQKQLKLSIKAMPNDCTRFPSTRSTLVNTCYNIPHPSSNKVMDQDERSNFQDSKVFHKVLKMILRNVIKSLGVSKINTLKKDS